MDMDSIGLADEFTDSGLNLQETVKEGDNINMRKAIEMRMTKARLEGAEEGQDFSCGCRR